ncbi:MAG: STAS domain-containing protein [Azovibrio sp.]|nr:STAS domain-containing protein [Azovibrio sp.]
MIARQGNRIVVQAPMLMSTARALLEAGQGFWDAQTWEVDLSAVSEADSAGLAVLLEWQRHCQAAGGVLRVLGMPAGLAALADLYDLGAAFARA